MRYLVLFIASILSACSSLQKKDFVPQINIKTPFTAKYEKTIKRALRSAEIKLSNAEGRKIRLQSNVSVEIKDRTENRIGLLVAGTSTYMPAIGSSIVINYVDDKLFEKLEHEFAHAILQSNSIGGGHLEKYDSLFYNWKTSRYLGSG